MDISTSPRSTCLTRVHWPIRICDPVSREYPRSQVSRHNKERAFRPEDTRGPINASRCRKRYLINHFILDSLYNCINTLYITPHYNIRTEAREEAYHKLNSGSLVNPRCCMMTVVNAVMKASMKSACTPSPTIARVNTTASLIRVCCKGGVCKT